MYDPMVAKLIVWDVDREHATARMLRALGEYHITELKTLIPFHQALLATEQWARGETCRDVVEDRKWLKELAFPKREAPAEPDDEEPSVEQTYTVEVSGRLRRQGHRATAGLERSRSGRGGRPQAAPARPRRRARRWGK